MLPALPSSRPRGATNTAATRLAVEPLVRPPPGAAAPASKLPQTGKPKKHSHTIPGNGTGQHTYHPQLNEKPRLGNQIPRSSRPEARATREDDHKELAEEKLGKGGAKEATPAGAPRRRRVPGTLSRLQPLPPRSAAIGHPDQLHHGQHLRREAWSCLGSGEGGGRG
jgi:hypothetical protein